jgi:hypothetical protein
VGILEVHHIDMLSFFSLIENQLNFDAGSPSGLVEEGNDPRTEFFSNLKSDENL